MTARLRLPRHLAAQALAALSATLCFALAGCVATPLREANQLSLAGKNEQALAVLDAARQENPADNALRSAQQRERDILVARLAQQADAARASGQTGVAAEFLARLEAIDPKHPRTLRLRAELARADRLEQLLANARRAFDAGRIAEAQTMVREVLAEAPGLPAARALQQRISDRAAKAAMPDTMAAAFQKRLTLEFRDAPLRNVFESIGRTSGVNFAFDKDVKADTKISIFLRDVTLDEAMRVMLATQQLDRKLLNDSSLLIYPNTPAKQQEHQELVTRSFYLSNGDVKQAQTLVKTMAKTRDVYIDERLNLLIVRDTPEVISLTERLIASIDLPEPEVILEVEVLEIGTTRLNELGLLWPDTVRYGVPNFVGQITNADRAAFSFSIANPAVTATLRGTSGDTNLIANPKLRARNHEKARVQIGERLPVFTSSAVSNVGTSTTVTYVDTGLRLEVEPSVQLDNDVIMKIGLDVTNLIGEVRGPQGSIAYRVGTRNATTSLRLRDGETGVLAGLISDEDRKAVQGVPGASELPIVGRLFGVHTDTRTKTELVLLVTPHVVRNLSLPDAATISGPAGNFASPGAATARLGPSAKVTLPMAGNTGTTGTAAATRPTSAGTNATAVAPELANAVLEVSTSGKVAVGQTVSVTLKNRSAASVRGQLGFDATLLQSAGLAQGNSLDFELEASGQKVFVLRVLPGAAGKSSQVQLDGLGATSANGAAVPVAVEGDPGMSFIAP